LCSPNCNLDETNGQTRGSSFFILDQYKGCI